MTTPFCEYEFPEPDLESTRAEYAKLHDRLDQADSVETCLEILKEWDSLLCTFEEWSSVTMIRFEQDTTNEAYIAAKDRLDEITPKFTALETDFKQALLDSPYREEIAQKTGSQLFEKWLCNTRSFAPEIEEDLASEASLESEFTSLTASGKVTFGDQEYTLPELMKFFDDADRDLRESSHRAYSQWYADHADELDHIYDQQVRLRHGMAQKLGYSDFTELGYQRMTRIGFGPVEVDAFRQEVRERVVPLAVEIAESQAETLGIDPLMYWDTGVHSKDGNPVPLGGHDWMVDRATEMFEAIGHGLDGFFAEMKSRGTMDLKSRPGKAGGGFCAFLPKYGFPFIFANFNGTRGDVDVFTHEMGHAFQSYSSRNLPMSDLIWPTTEACEIHSMGLEFLTWPYMDRFYGEQHAERLRRIHLTHYLHFLPYGVAIDHFQHLVYAKPDATPAERNAMWQEMESTYLPWHRYGDLPHEASGRRWQQKRHIYCSPFYYIDYCLASTGALQFWSMSRKDPQGSLKNYVHLCGLGGSLDYRGLLKACGLKSPFSKGCLDEVVADAKAYLES